jgi:hypothetical protein
MKLGVSEKVVLKDFHIVRAPFVYAATGRSRPPN